MIFRCSGDKQALQKYTALITLEVINDADFTEGENTSGFQHGTHVQLVTKTPNLIRLLFPQK